MTVATLARKRKNLSLEEKLIDGIQEMVDTTIGVNSFSDYVERVLAAHLIANNKLPVNYRVIGETRGGDRTQPKSKEDIADASN